MTLIETLESREEALNVRQVAELLGVSDKHIYELAAQGKLPAFRVGKAVRFDPQDVADWLRKRKPSNEGQKSTQAQKHKASRRTQGGQGAFHS
jgi:excisionase family DNA binding protein